MIPPTTPPSLPPDDLDRLLDATDPPTDAAAVERLNRAFRQERHRQFFRARLRVAVVVACSVAAVLAISVLVWQFTPATDNPTAMPLAVAPANASSAVVVGRPPSPDEHLALLRGALAAKQQPASATPETRTETARLMAVLRTSRHVDERMQAARHLGELADSATVKQLSKLSREPALRREAVAALMASRRPEAEAFFRSAEGQRLNPVRRALRDGSDPSIAPKNPRPQPTSENL